jgi:outer membrane protein
MIRRVAFPLAAALLLTGTLLGQQQPLPKLPVPAQDPNQPQIPDVPAISTYTPAVPATVTTGQTIPSRSSPTGLDARHFFGPYRRPKVPELFAGSSQRLQSLVRDGKLYLSARDAIALAIENNLDVEIERYNLVLADTDRRRAAGGGNLRGIDYTIAEPPNGVGGPGSPLLNTTATSPNPTSPTVTDLTSLNSTTQVQTNLSAASTATAQYSAGPSVPLFDPNLFLEGGYLRRSDSVSLTPATGASSTAPLDFIAANIAYLQGFRTGLQAEATVNDASQVLYGATSQRDPFSQPSTSFTLTQPLLRGFGSSTNLRYIRIANENRRISGLLFEQQVLETIYGASRIYFDLVSLGENVAVKQDALKAAQKLEEDDQAQVDLGTLAPIELTRAKALVSASQFDLTQAQGLYRTQEVILRNLILRTNSPVFSAAFTEIVPTDAITVPEAFTPPAVSDLIQQGLAKRPDLAQSELQIRTGQISAAASRNQALPQLNLYANVETRGVAEQAYEQLGTQGTAIPTLPQNFSTGGLKVSTIYQAGIQLNLPLRNRTAEADAARDAVQVRQTQARTEKLAEQIRENIENAEIALETSFAAYKAAESSRDYQEQLLQATRDLVEFGQSTNLNVVQNVAFLAQARSTEIAARSNWKKAQIELDRALGDLLEKNGISLEDAVQGQVKP